ISWPCHRKPAKAGFFSFPCSAWERNGTSKGYHAERGNTTAPARAATPSVGASETYSDHQLLSTGSSPSLSSFPRSVWEHNSTSKGSHAERRSQLFQRSAFLVPTLRVGMQRYQQGLPRRAWEPVRPI